MNEGNAGPPVGPGAQVRLAFALKLATGELVDETGPGGAEFTVGDGNLPPVFEKVMFGMRAGDSEEFPIKAEDGFGLVNEDNIQVLPRKAFGDDMALEPGLVVSFADKQEAELPGVVKRLFGELVEIDFNHPLAGKDLLFKVEIFEVNQVSNEIARM